MLDPSKAKSQSAPAKLASEFTSGQLIIAICMFLILALICFSLGVLVGQYGKREANPARSMQVRAPEPAAPMPPGPRTLEQTGRQEGVQTSPRMLPGAQPQKPPMPGFPSSPGVQGPPKTEPNVSELPAPQAKPVPPSAPTPPVEPAPATNSAGAVTPPATATTQTPPAPQPTAAAAPAETSAAKPEGNTLAPAPTTPIATPPAATPLAATPPAAAPPVQPLPGASTSPSMQPAAVQNAPTAPAVAAPGKGTYAIQVAAFSGPKRKEIAEQYRKRLASNAGLESDLVPSEDGKSLRVLVGSYPDKGTAAKACEELKKRAGFADSFVKRR